MLSAYESSLSQNSSTVCPCCGKTHQPGTEVYERHLKRAARRSAPTETKTPTVGQTEGYYCNRPRCKGVFHKPGTKRHQRDIRWARTEAVVPETKPAPSTTPTLSREESKRQKRLERRAKKRAAKLATRGTASPERRAELARLREELKTKWLAAVTEMEIEVENEDDWRMPTDEQWSQLLCLYHPTAISYGLDRLVDFPESAEETVLGFLYSLLRNVKEFAKELNVEEKALFTLKEFSLRLPSFIDKPYKEDPWTLTPDGHYMDLSPVETGKEAFIVPKDFDEFLERNPKYILNWVRKMLNKPMIDDDVMDWAQDLALHMRALSPTSRYRQPNDRYPNGCSDRIEIFDPVRMHGATPARFYNWVNKCMRNCFLTVKGQHKKNPMMNQGNLSFGEMDESTSGVGNDEYIHKNSDYLTNQANDAEKGHFDRMFIRQFIEFVSENDPAILPVIYAIGEARTFNEAQADLGMEDSEFSRSRKRLKQLKDAFLNSTAVPKKRKTYQKKINVSVLA